MRLFSTAMSRSLSATRKPLWLSSIHPRKVLHPLLGPRIPQKAPSVSSISCSSPPFFVLDTQDDNQERDYYIIIISVIKTRLTFNSNKSTIYKIRTIVWGVRMKNLFAVHENLQIINQEMRVISYKIYK